MKTEHSKTFKDSLSNIHSVEILVNIKEINNAKIME